MLNYLSVRSPGGLTPLPGNLFYGLSKLESLLLISNRLTALDSDQFAGLNSLHTLNLSGNRLSSLPDGLFSELKGFEYLNLTGNTVDPLPIAIGLEAAGGGAFKATVRSGAPFRIELPVVVTNGQLSDGSSTVVIPAGSTESAPISVSRLTGTTGTVTVDIGTLPPLPSASHSGYALVKSGSLPLEVATDAVTGTPEVSIASHSSPVTEGEAAAFTLTRTGNTAAALTLDVSVSETGATVSGTAPATATFAAGSATAALTVATEDDAVVEDASTITATVAAGTDYTVNANASSAEVTVNDNDAVTFTVSASPTQIEEGEASTLTVAIANGVTFEVDQTIDLDLTASTAAAADYVLTDGGGQVLASPYSLTLAAGASEVTATVTAVDDTEQEPAETIEVAASLDGTSIGSATIKIAASDAFTARFESVPESHDGSSAFSFELHFSEEFPISYRTLRDGAFEASGGSVTSARRLVKGSNIGWQITIEPDSDEDIVVTLPSRACGETGAVCTGDGRTLAEAVSSTVPGPASGLPRISIAPASSPVTEGTAATFTLTRTGSTAAALTVDVSVSETGATVSGTAPATATFAADSSTAALSVATEDDTVVEAASTITATVAAGTGYTADANASSAEVAVDDNDSATFTVSASPAQIDEGEASTLTVAIANGVTFAADQTIALDLAASTAAAADYTVADGGGQALAAPYALTLTAGASTVTATVTATDDSEQETAETIEIAASLDGTSSGSATIEVAASDALTARLENVPESHDGSTAFSFELYFNEEFRIGRRKMRDGAFEVSGGSVTSARRLVKGSNIGWEITVEPASDADLVVTLPARACTETGAVCTADGRTLLEAVSATIPGPASGLPRISIAPASSPVTEGTAATFTLTRTGSTAAELTVDVNVSETGATIAGTAPSTATFTAGSGTADLTVATEDDEVVEDASTITATVEAGTGYSVDANALSTEVDVEDDDASPVVTTVSPVAVAENETAVATLTATDEDTAAADLVWSIPKGSAGGTDADAFALTAAGALSFTSAKDFEAPDDADQDGAYEVTVEVSDGTNEVLADLTVQLRDVDEIAPTMSDASVDADTLTLTFSEALDEGSVPESSAFEVTVAGSTRGISNVSVSGSAVTLTLASAVASGATVTVGYTVLTGTNANPLQDVAGNPAATLTNESVTNNSSNTAPTGLPSISGTARVGETLTASASGIADGDGLTNATFAWQWIANDGHADADIAGATASTYTLTSAEAGKTVKVRATFTDDGGTQESLVSDPSGAVAGALTARFESVPASHDGSGVFTLELAFTEAVFDGTEPFNKNQAIRDALTVTGGTVRGGRRVDPDAYDRWIVWIGPSGGGTVTVTLPATTGACTEAGAICTPDGEALSNAPEATVPGPASQTREVSIVAVSDPVTEGTAAVFTLVRTGSLTSALTVNVEVSESEAMLKGAPPATVTFDANSATAELSLETEDDEVAEPASVVTSALEAGSDYAMVSGASSATVTVEDDDAAPVVTTASPIVTPENETTVTTLAATDDDTPVADLAWSMAGGADAAAFTLGAGGELAFASAKDFEAPDDADGDGAWEVTVRVTDGANPVDAPLTIRLADVDEVVPVLRSATVTGDTLTLTFSEALDGGSTPGPSAFTATVGGTTRSVDAVAVLNDIVTLTLASGVSAGETVTVGYTAPTGPGASPLQDAAGNAVAGFSNEAVTNATPGSNALPTGLPTIAGTARVGETLTASASAIADDDGLGNATFAWQWVANDGSSDADIAGATDATYMLTAAEAGKTIKVQVTFTDDGGNEETLVSEATAEVAAALPVVSIGAASSPVTEGEAAAFTLSRTGDTAAGLTVSVAVSQDGSVLSGTPASTVAFAVGDTQATLGVATDNDGVAEADGRVTATIAAGTGYAVSPDAASAGVDVYDNDEPASTAAETLWTSTLTVFDLAGIITGLYEGLGGDLSPDGWTEDGRPFRAEQLYYYSGSSELVFDVSAWPPDSGELTLHVGALQLRLSDVAGTHMFTWTVDNPGWQAGQAVAVKLVRATPEAAPDAGPGISVADAQVQEAEGAVLAFEVTLDASQTSAVSVRYATSDGTAEAGIDYVARTGVLRFAPGETAKTVSVPVLNDDHDEGSETLTLTLSSPFGAQIADGTATGTIVNTDPMPQAWLARFGRTVADQVLDAVEGRMAAARTAGTEVSLAGQQVGEAGAEEDSEAHEAEAGLDRLTEWLRGAGGEEEASALQSRTVSGRELLSGTSFALTAGSAESGFGALWGRGAVSRFDGREGDVTLDGEVASALLGADFTRGRGTAGLVVAHSLGEGGYRSPNGGGEVETTLTGLYPWGRYAASERLSLWGIAGYGAGTLTLTPEGQAPIETDMGPDDGGAGRSRGPGRGAGRGRSGAQPHLGCAPRAHDVGGGAREPGQPRGVGGRRDAAQAGPRGDLARPRDAGADAGGGRAP